MGLPISSYNERDKLIVDNMGLVGQVIKDRVHNVNGIGVFGYDDLFQIGCVGLMKAADTFKPGKSQFSTYAYTVIRNEIFDALEYATVRRNRETAADMAHAPYSRTDDLPDISLHDLNRILDVAQSESSGVIKKGIIALRLLSQGYTYREIGERMNVSANNVSAWVARARKALRARPEIAAIR
jgi:RNA polymerase sigma factor (sigma-70 family)